MSDELKIVLEDVREKFDTVIETFNMVKERLDRHEQAEEEHFQRIEDRFDRHEASQEERLQRIENSIDHHEMTQEKCLQRIEDRVISLQKDFYNHRENTELHGVKKEEKGFLNRHPLQCPNSNYPSVHRGVYRSLKISILVSNSDVSPYYSI